MGRPKGSKSGFTFRTKEEKYSIIKPILDGEISTVQQSKNLNMNSGMLTNWIKLYLKKGISGLENKKKPGNPLSKYMHRKELSKEEQLEYEILKLRIENERLKKGYTTEEVDRIKKQYKKNMK